MPVLKIDKAQLFEIGICVAFPNQKSIFLTSSPAKTTSEMHYAIFIEIAFRLVESEIIDR